MTSDFRSCFKFRGKTPSSKFWVLSLTPFHFPQFLPTISQEALPAFSTQTLSVRDTVMDSIHTVQTEALHSRTFCHQRSDEQEGRTDRYLAPGQEGGSEEQEGEEPSCSPWLQTGLYLSPGLFRIFSSCLWLKLDTPMDLVSPASSHFSRAWEGGVVNSREQSLGMGNKTRLMAAKKKKNY